MSANDSKVKQLVSNRLDESIINKLKNEIASMATPDVAGLPQGSALERGVVLGPAVAMMPDGTIHPLDPTQTLTNNNWLATSPRYVLVKQADHDYLIDCHAPLGGGGAGNVYSAYILPHGNPIGSPIIPVVVKVARSNEEDALKNEVRFVTEDVVPYGDEGKRILGVGNHAIAIFDYIPGQKLVQPIGEEGIVVENALLTLGFADRCQLAIDLCTKIANIHEKKFCHLDLNWDNVLVDIDDQGKYKACRIFDHGQSQYFSNTPLKNPTGKLYWNSKQANLPYGYGCSKYPLRPSPEIDIVPLGVMCDILFAAREGKNPEDYNTFQKRQEALSRVEGNFRRNQTDAIVGAPFVIHHDFIDGSNWNLEIATADRLNELMQVFFERMVSDLPDERATAAEAVEFFEAIKKLNSLNEGCANDANNQKDILSYCEELAFQTKKINEALPVIGSALNVNASWYVERKIDLLLHMLTYPAYLMRMELNFCETEIKRLISFFGEEENFSPNAIDLKNLLSLLADDLIEKQIKIRCVNAVMQMMLLDRKERQLKKESRERFGGLPEYFSTQWTEDEQGQLDSINKEEMYKRIEGRDLTEIMEDGTLPEIFRIHILIQEKKLFLYRETELRAARTTIQSIISSDNKIQTINKNYSLFEFNDVGDHDVLKSDSGNEPDVDRPIEIEIGESDIESKDSSDVIEEKEQIFTANDPYTEAFQYYKAALDFYRSAAEAEQCSDASQEYSADENPVLKTGQAFLKAITPAEKQSQQEKEALTKLFVFQAQQLSSCFSNEGNSFPKKPQKLNNVNPDIADCDRAINDLAKNEQRSLKAAAAIAVGVLLGVTAVFAAAITLTALCPFAGALFIGVLAPLAGHTMLTAASAAIATVGYVIGVGIGCKIEDNFQERRVAARAVHAVKAVQAAKKEAVHQSEISSSGKKPTSLLTRIGLFGCSSKHKEDGEAHNEAPNRKAAI